MIDNTSIGAGALQTQNTVTETKKVLKMVKNERMGGMVPKWETVTVTKKLNVESNLSEATQAKPAEDSFKTTLAYQNDQDQSTQDQGEEFGFGDLIDMINPLHHIPVVGHLYRNFTGDEIKPIGKIIGGAVFGGPVGAGVNLVNTVIEKETGKDLTSNAVALALKGEAPSFKIAQNTHASPEDTLNQVARDTQINDLPASLLAFTDNGNSGAHIEKSPASSGRTAGTMHRLIQPDLSLQLLMAREPITEVTIRRMPDEY